MEPSQQTLALHLPCSFSAIPALDLSKDLLQALIGYIREITGRAIVLKALRGHHSCICV